jgi:hypothetical protein
MHDRADNILQTLAEVYQIEGTFCENGCASLHHQMQPASSLACGYTLLGNTTLHNQAGNDDPYP